MSETIEWPLTGGRAGSYGKEALASPSELCSIQPRYHGPRIDLRPNTRPTPPHHHRSPSTGSTVNTGMSRFPSQIPKIRNSSDQWLRWGFNWDKQTPEQLTPELSGWFCRLFSTKIRISGRYLVTDRGWGLCSQRTLRGLFIPNTKYKVKPMFFRARGAWLRYRSTADPYIRVIPFFYSAFYWLSQRAALPPNRVRQHVWHEHFSSAWQVRYRNGFSVTGALRKLSHALPVPTNRGQSPFWTRPRNDQTVQPPFLCKAVSLEMINGLFSPKNFSFLSILYLFSSLHKSIFFNSKISAIAIQDPNFKLNMSSATGKVSFFEAHGEDSSEEGPDVQPSDPGKISLTIVKCITGHFRLWQMSLLRLLICRWRHKNL
jgi:hypothetical protein